MACILLVSSEGRIGGAETSLLLLAKHLCSRLALSAACPGSSPLSAAFTSLGIEHHAMPEPPRAPHRSLRYTTYWMASARSLAQVVRRTGVDVIHANTFYAGIVALLGSFATRRKLLLHARDLADFGLLTRLLGRGAERIIAVSHAVRHALIARGVSPDKIDVVYNGLGSWRSAADEDPTALRPARADGHFTFAHVGQFAPWKNHAAFLQAAAHVARELPQGRFAVIGDDLFQRDGSYRQELYRLARRSAAAERIQFWGWREDMEEVWPAVDCLVHTAEREAFGRVVIEAMSHRIPVIAVASGGPAEIVESNRTGWLVPPGDVRALAGAMLRAARDRELADAVADAGYRHVLSNFTARRTADRVHEIYESILSA